jgi:hypothetical protein
MKNEASIIRSFFSLAAIFLFLTGVAKIWSAFGAAKILTTHDMIFGVQFRILFFTVGLIELFVGWACLDFLRRKTFSAIILAGFATNLLMYRIGLSILHWQRPCHCLGNLTDALHIPPQIAEISMKIILAYLLIGSYATLFWLWRQKRQVPPVAPSLAPPVSAA